MVVLHLLGQAAYNMLDGDATQTQPTQKQMRWSGCTFQVCCRVFLVLGCSSVHTNCAAHTCRHHSRNTDMHVHSPPATVVWVRRAAGLVAVAPKRTCCHSCLRPHDSQQRVEKGGCVCSVRAAEVPGQAREKKEHTRSRAPFSMYTAGCLQPQRQGYQVTLAHR